MPTAIDLFEKARTHDRVEQLRAAREQDLMRNYQDMLQSFGAKAQ